MLNKLSGVIPPMITPFKKNGELDESSLKELVEFLSQHVDGLFICGSYGCGPLMSLEERMRVAEITKKYAGNNTKVVVHTGTTNTRDTITLTQHAKSIGCDAAAAVGPYYYSHQDVDVLSYYSDILSNCQDFPFYIYNNPKFQGYSISLNTLKELKKQGLAGIKDATFDIMQHAVYQRELCDENFDVTLGTEAMWVSAHALGCRAFIPGIGNVYPELCKQMWNESMNGENEKALATQFRINQLRDVMYLARSTQLAIYAIAEIKGIMKAYPRAPFVPATETEMEKVRSALQGLGLV